MAAPDPTFDWRAQLAGRFIVFDGPDGSGKTTQFRRFVRFVHELGLEVCEVREPGSTTIGEQIRQILLDPENDGMDVRCEMLLYMASRAQLVAQRLRPAREAGHVILADRFISSTLAYQGTAGGVPIEDVMTVGQIALRDCWPDLTVIFDVDPRTAAMRMDPALRERENDWDLDRMELKGSDFQRTVRQGFLDQAANDPQRHLVIDATAEIDTVYGSLLASLPTKLRDR